MMFYFFTGINCTKILENPKMSYLKKKKHCPYYLLVKNQWFEKLTKGTALGGLVPPNDTHVPPIKKTHRETCFR